MKGSIGAVARVAVEPSGRVGELVAVGGSWTYREGFVIDDVASMLRVATRKGLEQVPSYKARTILGTQFGRCPPGRLLAGVQYAIRESRDVGVHPSEVQALAVQSANQSIATARLCALDALDLGVPQLLTDLIIPVEEAQLLWAWHELRSGRYDLTIAQRLVQAWGAFPAQCTKLAVTLGGALSWSKPFLREIAAHPSGAALADVVLRAAGEAPTDLATTVKSIEVIDGQLGGRLGTGCVGSIKDLEDVVAGRDLMTGPPPTWLADSGRAAWCALSQADQLGKPMAVGRRALTGLPVSLQEDLARAGAVSASAFEDTRLRFLATQRATPDAVRAADAKEASFVELAAWLALRDRDVRFFEGLPEGRPEVDALRTLTRLAVGDRSVDGSALDRLPGPERQLASALVDCLQAESWGDAPPALVADASTWPILLQLEPPPEPAGKGALVAITWLQMAKAALHRWDWKTGADAARQALGAADGDRRRREALNLLAAALWQQGTPDSAMAALDRGLEGKAGDGALVNAALLSVQLDPVRAQVLFARLAREGSTAQLRGAAALRSLELWGEAASGDEASPLLPVPLRDAMRALLREDELDDEHWTEFLRVLANLDSTWVAQAKQDAFGRRGGSPIGRVLRGQATGPTEWIKAMAKALRESKDERVRRFVEGQRDGLVQDVVSALLEDDADFGVAGVAMIMLDERLPVEPEDAVSLGGLSTWVASKQLIKDGNEPAEMLFDYLVTADGLLRSLGAVERERLGPVVAGAAETLATAMLIVRAKTFDDVIEGYNNTLATLATTSRLLQRRRRMREFLDSALEFLDESVRLIDKVRPMVSDDVLRRELGEFRGAQVDAKRSAGALRGQL